MGRVRNALSKAVGGGRDEADQQAMEREMRLHDEIQRLRKQLERLEKRVAAIEPERPEVFHAGMTLAEVRSAHPDADAVLARHHLGGCASCAVSEVETLEQGTQLHQVDLPGLLIDLNALA
jgi:hypothetical protein